MAEPLLWTVTVLLFVIGLAGVVFPLLPGLTLVFLGAALHAIPGWSSRPLSLLSLAILFAMLLAGYVVEFATGFAAAKRFGLSRAGLIGGVLGLAAGFFFSPLGWLLGPVVGIFLGQVIGARQRMRDAMKATAGYAAGTLVGIVLKLLIGFLMIGYFFWAI